MGEWTVMFLETLWNIVWFHAVRSGSGSSQSARSERALVYARRRTGAERKSKAGQRQVGN